MNLTLNGLDMTRLSTNATGPLGWIKEGLMDISVDISFPEQEKVKKPKTFALFPDKDESNIGTSSLPSVLFTFNIGMNYMQLNPPIYSSDLDYVSNILVHPISVYMNKHAKHLPLLFSFALPLVIFLEFSDGIF